MAFCEMCGRESLLSRTKIENTELLVCGSCSTFGKVIKTNIEEPEVPKARKPQIYNETVEIIPEGYGKKVKDARTWAGIFYFLPIAFRNYFNCFIVYLRL